jgi:CheY-like chemotaxis protein
MRFGGGLSGELRPERVRELECFVSKSITSDAEMETAESHSGAFGPTGTERRRRRRAKLSAEVHIRAVNSPTPFQEICKTVDVSRDGLLIVSPHSGYWKGQPLEVTFPYSTAPSALNQSQPAEVVRVSDYGGGLFGVAVQFTTTRNSARAANPLNSKSGLATSTQQRQPSVVLAIEPDVRSTEATRNLLQRDGYTFVVVANAQAALDVLKTTVPVVFITPDDNPDISGHDLCLIIKGNDRLQHVPVILITSTPQPADYAASRQLGAVVCMAKPLASERLLQVIRLVAPPPAERSAYGARVHKDAIERTI